MKVAFLVLTAACLLISAGFGQIPQAISYQGYLEDSTGQGVTASLPMTFRLFSDSTGGLLFLTQTFGSVPISNGVYSVILNVSTVSFSRQIWLETQINGQTLSPRARLTSVPYALQALSVLGPNSIATGVGAIVGGTNNRARGIYSTVGGGGGPSLSDSNSATEQYSTVAGGTANLANGWWSTIGGGDHNVAFERATVGGGGYNSASSSSATVSGGYGNSASGGYATVGGGYGNASSGRLGTVSGGLEDTAAGEYSSVPGGSGNTAAGKYSFAAGRRAKALNDGAFVWADSIDADFASTQANQFLIRASGGVGIGTTNPQSTLHVAGSVTADAYTKLGSTAPAIKMKKVMGTTAASQGSSVTIAHGLTDSQILSIDVMVEWATASYIHPGYTFGSAYLFNWTSDGSGNIIVRNISASSGSILSKPIKILITYEE